MAQSSRRIFLLLTGALLIGAIAQKTEVLKKVESSPLPKPNLKRLSPSPTKSQASQSPTPKPSKKKTAPTPAASPTEAPSSQATHTEILEGVFIAKSDELILHQTQVFTLKDLFGISTSYSLTRTSRGIVAFDTRCTHAQAPCFLSESLLQCPAHGSVFDPENGEVLRGPAVEPLKSYRTLEVNGEVRIIIS